jgi:hypothetical protein
MTSLIIIGQTDEWGGITIVRYKVKQDDGSYRYGVLAGGVIGHYNEPTPRAPDPSALVGRPNKEGYYTSAFGKAHAMRNYPELPESPDFWFAVPTEKGVTSSPLATTLGDAVEPANGLVVAMALGMPKQAQPKPLTQSTHADAPDIAPAQPPEPVGPRPAAVTLRFDGQGWLVEAGQLIRPFRFIGRIAAEQYAEQVGEKYALKVVTG